MKLFNLVAMLAFSCLFFACEKDVQAVQNEDSVELRGDLIEINGCCILLDTPPIPAEGTLVIEVYRGVVPEINIPSKIPLLERYITSAENVGQVTLCVDSPGTYTLYTYGLDMDGEIDANAIGQDALHHAIFQIEGPCDESECCDYISLEVEKGTLCENCCTSVFTFANNSSCDAFILIQNGKQNSFAGGGEQINLISNGSVNKTIKLCDRRQRYVYITVFVNGSKCFKKEFSIGDCYVKP